MLINLTNNCQTNIACPQPLKTWLNYQKSMTKKLLTITDNVHLSVINQHWCQANWWDKFVLNINTISVLQREIVISAWQIPCWYARTIIPDTTYQNNQTCFNRLNDESLGDIIFSATNIKRTSLTNYAIDPQCIEYYWLNTLLTTNVDLLWVRLSIFIIDNKAPFFLIEILLPGLFNYINREKYISNRT